MRSGYSLAGFLLWVMMLCGVVAPVQAAEKAVIEVSGVALGGLPVEATVEVRGVLAEGIRVIAIDSSGYETEYTPSFDAAKATISTTFHGMGGGAIRVLADREVLAEKTVHVIPGWMSLIPALLAISIALIFKQVIPALLLGVLSGAWIARGLMPEAFGSALLDTIDTYLLRAMVPESGSTDHMAILLFTLITGGMIGVISQNGGMGGIVRAVVRLADTARKGQIATALMGLAVFFDDYANTIIVGNTMRPVTDRLRISREKLAYLVDSTSAPLACLAMVTTWIGFQVSLIGEATGKIDGLSMPAYHIMLYSIPYSFYPLLAIVFLLMVVWTGRDFGPMYQAEEKARRLGVKNSPVETPELDTLDDKEHGLHVDTLPARSAWLAVIPIIVLVGSTMVGLYATGEGETLSDIIGSANAFNAMLWASFLSLLTAVVMTVISGTLNLHDTMNAMQDGLSPMLLAGVILTFAWAISDVNSALHTPEYIVSLLGERVGPIMLPAFVFVIAALTAFATGASWGTMGILMPLVIPLAWTVMTHHGLIGDPSEYGVLYASVASVLAGAVWGDHCSPISDTTILSSMASQCDHIAHVRTQLPYAVLVGVVAMVVGVVPTAAGLPWWVSLAAGIVVLYGVLRLFGRQVDATPNEANPAKMATPVTQL